MIVVHPVIRIYENNPFSPRFFKTEVPGIGKSAVLLVINEDSFMILITVTDTSAGFMGTIVHNYYFKVFVSLVEQTIHT